jgi:hypothetical protein
MFLAILFMVLSFFLLVFYTFTVWLMFRTRDFIRNSCEGAKKLQKSNQNKPFPQSKVQPTVVTINSQSSTNIHSLLQQARQIADGGK